MNRGPSVHFAEMIEFFSVLFRPASADDTILLCDETIFRFWRRTPETADDYQAGKQRRTASAGTPGDSQMRTISVILAFAFVLAGPSLSGSTDNNLPGIGTFAYNGSPIATSTPHSILVAAR
jgi:hypothetical protein